MLKPVKTYMVKVRTVLAKNNKRDIEALFEKYAVFVDEFTATQGEKAFK